MSIAARFCLTRRATRPALARNSRIPIDLRAADAIMILPMCTLVCTHCSRLRLSFGGGVYFIPACHSFHIPNRHFGLLPDERLFRSAPAQRQVAQSIYSDARNPDD